MADRCRIHDGHKAGECGQAIGCRSKDTHRGPSMHIQLLHPCFQSALKTNPPHSVHKNQCSRSSAASQGTAAQDTPRKRASR
eukprot:scaffold320_cov335-Pavlova_lutheri.AAC.16